MPKFAELTPAYGRDYKNGTEAKAAFLQGKDWVYRNCCSPWDGRYCSIRDFENDGETLTVILRFKQLQNIATISMRSLDKERSKMEAAKAKREAKALAKGAKANG